MSKVIRLCDHRQMAYCVWESGSPEVLVSSSVGPIARGKSGTLLMKFLLHGPTGGPLVCAGGRADCGLEQKASEAANFFVALSGGS